MPFELLARPFAPRICAPARGFRHEYRHPRWVLRSRVSREVIVRARRRAIGIEARGSLGSRSDWFRRVAVTRAWGDRWLREADTALLVVRSVLVPETYNVLINPRHADAGRIKRIAVMPYPLDSRLLVRD